MGRRSRDRSWVGVDAVGPLPAPVTDNHTHLPTPGLPPSGPGSEAPLPVGEILERAAQVGVRRVITSACELPEWEGALTLADAYPQVRVALAIHPNEAVLHAGVREIGPDGLEPQTQEHHRIPLDEAMGLLERQLDAAGARCVAVGETGLDFFRTGPQGAEAQRAAFRAHIALAKERGLPLQIHDRDAHDECVRVLLSDGAPERVVFHCFSGGRDLAQACAEQRWYASIAGPITYPANAELREAVALLPAELLLVETDAPYLPPTPWRGRPNASYLLPQTLHTLAQVRDCSLEEMCAQVEETSRRVYGDW